MIPSRRTGNIRMNLETDLEYYVSTFQKCGSKPKIIICQCIPASNNLIWVRKEIIKDEIYPIQKKVAMKFL